ncbi:hypothetical protein NP493_315g03076 [Ridgeia piscesae]|uniref:G protein gamma domain-containing protein n=1 Tax=Ridgeia piscesae TaxID=27915 RepID=A0AAD9NWE0_RIDPI|nr:hypothetical protein NP493_315g03076 [Ridgeia piscesae]
MERMKVSKSVQGLIEYCRDNLQADPLYCPVKENPFKEKKSRPGTDDRRYPLLRSRCV